MLASIRASKIKNKRLKLMFFTYTGFTGPYCEAPVKIDPCFTLSCNTDCTVVNGTFSCACWQIMDVECPSASDPCPPHTYGPNCQKECRPTDSCEGHYICDPDNGDKICLPGWKGIDCTVRDFQGVVDPECSANDSCTGGVCFNKSCCYYTGNKSKHSPIIIFSQVLVQGTFYKDHFAYIQFWIEAFLLHPLPL